MKSKLNLTDLRESKELLRPDFRKRKKELTERLA